MATTTTNFGWDIPQSTDLVKDGATAIAALGQDIDTALVDLKGGTTGQVLAKASGTDLDFSWVAQDDSNAIQNAIVDAKGDLIGATAADTPARLAVGTNGQVLTADSTAATGLAWATPAAGTFKGASAYRTTAQSISNNTLTAVLLDAELFDTDAFHSTATNTSRFTIPAGLGGKYMCTASVGYAVNSTGFRVIAVAKNGTVIFYSNQVAGSTQTIGNEIASIVSVNAADYIEFFVQQTSGGSLNTSSGSQDMFFQIQYLGA
jgi:hypothetical protein